TELAVPAARSLTGRARHWPGVVAFAGATLRRQGWPGCSQHVAGNDAGTVGRSHHFDRIVCEGILVHRTTHSQPDQFRALATTSKTRAWSDPRRYPSCSRDRG